MLPTRTRLGVVVAVLMLLLAAVRPAAAQDDYGGDIDYQQFYDELDPYGQWVSDPDYGYVWIPDAGDDFRPYASNGYWTYTDYGNTWVSNYSWGWAPFHYGRWTYHNYYGWMWIPGNVWGPAWVSWRSGGGNYGWAPLGPGISVNIAVGGYNCPDYWWNFAPQQYIFNRNWNRYSYGPRGNVNYIRQTTVINNTYIVNNNRYLGGPRRNDLRAAIGRDPRPLRINDVRGPRQAQVRGDRLNIYRPAIVSNGADRTMRPRDFRPVDRPIRGNTPVNASGFGSYQDPRPSRIDRSPVNNSGPVNQNDRRGFDRNSATPRTIREMPQQPDGRGFGGRRVESQQPVPATQDNRNWNDGPVRTQPQVQPQRGFDRSQRSFDQQQMQQRSFEQRQPQMQPQQRSFDRPQPAFEQPRPQMQPQRMEAPRQAPNPGGGGFGSHRDRGR